MKRLDKILLVNWHYIVLQQIDVSQISFLTGKNGAGKSTILDALQMLILGDTTGHFFNKAANDNAKRNLKGYLYGEVAEEEEGNTVYLRGGKTFSSYVVAQFTDTVKNNSFCVGAVFDCDSGGEHTHRFFSLFDELPAFQFVRNNIPLDIQLLRAWGASLGKNKFEFYESNKRYQEMFRSQMGSIGEKFFALFRKAVPFSPIMDVAGFISDFVCDVEHRLDIEDMQENIRHYRRLEQELQYVQRKVQSLEVIAQKSESVDVVIHRLKSNQYLLDRARVSEKEARLAALDKSLQAASARLQELVGLLQRDSEQIGTLQSKRDAWIEERARSDVYLSKQRLEQEMKQLETSFSPILVAIQRQERALLDWQSRWLAVGQAVSSANQWFIGNNDANTEDDLSAVDARLVDARTSVTAALAPLRKAKQVPDAGLSRMDVAAYDLSSDALEQAQTSLTDAAESLHEANRLVQTQLRAWKEELTELAQVIANLERGMIPYDSKVTRLQEAIAAGLREQTGKEIPITIFAEMMEISDAKWHHAIEGYLHTQRFNLIVPPEQFHAALQIYNKVKIQQRIFDVGLVDIGRILEETPEASKGSLAEEIQTDDLYARAYANHLLGRVMKCDDVRELRQYRTAITADGMLYQNFVARQLNPERWASLYIGKRALEQQLAQRRDRLKHVNEHNHLWGRRAEETAVWARMTAPSTGEIRDICETQGLLARVPEMQRDHKRMVTDLGALDLSFLLQLDNKIQSCDADIIAIESHRKVAFQEQAQVERDEQQIQNVDRPEAELVLKETEKSLVETYTVVFREGQEPRYLQELDRLGTPQQVTLNFNRQMTADYTRKETFWGELVTLRSDYNRDFQAGFDIQRLDNGAYESELQRLIDSQLTHYETSIREAKERAQVQFQEDFISKLQSNIYTVEQQIRDLNVALRGISFGRDQYRFQINPNPQYLQFYQMIMDELLMEGFGLFSQVFQDKHGSVVEELFRNIVDVNASDPLAMTELEKNLEKFTDYRTYLNFDLIVKDEEGRESRLSRVISKKSGGETQTPFYISVLASFVQLYRIGRSGSDNTLRLIVFDEAYSKMDHQRIQESIKLIRDLDLQVILSAPTEKLADIAPMVDKTMIVTRLGSQTKVLEFNILDEVVNV